MNLIFATPWLLAAALAIPLLYALLRLTPPAPKTVRLPSLKLLGERDGPPPPAGRPPLWLLLLRLGAVTLLLLGLAGPSLRPETGLSTPPRLLLLIDNGWAAGASWERMRAAAVARLDALRFAGTRVAVVPTARSPGGQLQPPRFADVEAARATVEALQPQPWPTDRAVVAATLPLGVPGYWVADGVEDAGAAALRRALRGGEVAVVPPTAAAIGLAGLTAGGWTVQAIRPPGAPVEGAVVAHDSRGAEVARGGYAGERETISVPVDVEPEARGRVARLEIDGGDGAASVRLTDAGAGRPRVAVVEGERPGELPPLESGGFYVRRARLRRATLEDAARDPARLLLLVDASVPRGPLADALLRKVRGGAVVVSFAGPRIAENGSALSPAPLRTGARALGGTLSWQKPLAVSGFAARTPLAGLPTGPEATVARQVLAIDGNAAARWAWLSDGTPLVSARREGAGLVVMVHTSAAPGWSTLPLTGLFEAMLARLLPLAMSPAALDVAPVGDFVLERMLDGRGDLVAPPSRAVIPAARWEMARATPQTPPGLYRAGELVRALNLELGPAFRFVPLRTDGLRIARTAAAPFDLGRWLIAAALLLLAIDAVVALVLRGAIARPALAAMLALAALTPDGAAAQTRQATVEVGYVRTGNPARDRVSAEGVTALARVVAVRTAVAPGTPVAVDPGRGGLGRYALLYWPVTGGSSLSPAALANVRAYLARGGMILFDLVGGADARPLLGPLGLPPLEEVTDKHVLMRSFYRIDRLPGPVWTEAGTTGEAGRVAGVIIATGDWASRWRGAGYQAEGAWRFGVNTLMYALTGTYKADQVHTRNLLDRMRGQPPR